jgi:hypothetical protein
MKPNGMAVLQEFEMMWNETAVAYFKALCWNNH